MSKCVCATNPAPYLGILFDFIKKHDGVVKLTLKTDLLEQQLNDIPLPISVAVNHTFPCRVTEVYPNYVILQKYLDGCPSPSYYTILFDAIIQISSPLFETHYEQLLQCFSCVYPICEQPCLPGYARYRDLATLLKNPALQETSLNFLYNGITTRIYLIKNIHLLGNLLFLERYSIIPLSYIGGFTTTSSIL